MGGGKKHGRWAGNLWRGEYIIIIMFCFCFLLFLTRDHSARIYTDNGVRYYLLLADLAVIYFCTSTLLAPFPLVSGYQF